jgi:type II secretory pathway pseudopilin PulG
MQSERGFTYIGVLILVIIMGVVLAAAGELWHSAQQREKEQQLLFVGNQYRQALAQYYRRTPGAAVRYPRRLADLLADPRYPLPQRYLRQLYPDPVSGSAGWGLLKTPSGEIMGVYSQSEATPIKQANFKLADKKFEGKSKYSDWVFTQATP